MRQIVRKIVKPEAYSEISSRSRNFIILPDTEKIQAGDTLIMMEWQNGFFTDSTPVRRCVKHVSRAADSHGIAEGYCVVGW